MKCSETAFFFFFACGGGEMDFSACGETGAFFSIGDFYFRSFTAYFFAASFFYFSASCFSFLAKSRCF